MIKIGIILCAILAIVSFGHAKRTRSTRQKIVPAYFQAIANNQAKISSSFQQSDANSKSAKIQTLTTGTTPEGHYFEEEEIIEQLSPENFAPSNVFEYPVPELHAVEDEHDAPELNGDSFVFQDENLYFYNPHPIVKTVKKQARTGLGSGSYFDVNFKNLAGGTTAISNSLSTNHGATAVSKSTAFGATAPVPAYRFFPLF